MTPWTAFGWILVACFAALVAAIVLTMLVQGIRGLRARRVAPAPSLELFRAHLIDWAVTRKQQAFISDLYPEKPVAAVVCRCGQSFNALDDYNDPAAAELAATGLYDDHVTTVLTARTETHP